MKKLWVIMILAAMLSGCGAAETFETVNDEINQPVMGQQKEVVLALPSSAASPVVNSDDGARLYLCDGYDLMVQVLPGGDIERTVESLCGYDGESISVVETAQSGVKRYEWVWTSAGEGGDQIGRAVVLSDGDYHYCVSVMADARDAGALETEWTAVLAGMKLV